MKDNFTVILSEHVAPDSDVNVGGGADRTFEIQKILDIAKERGGLHLIVDGAYTTDTLKVHSHTTIECVNESCGFFLKDHVTHPLIINANCRAAGERIDRDIRFIGGTYNFNCTKQEHHIVCPDGTDDVSVMAEYGNTGFRIFGVENFVMRDVVLKDQRTYALACGNAKYVTMENIRIDLPHLMFAQNQDGLHFFGESRFITLKNIRGCAGDDFIAFTSDELDGVSSISDVLVDGVQLEGSDQGIRLLTHGKGKLDRVIIRNVTGTYTSYGFFINPWDCPQFRPGEKFGNFGSITLENIDLRQEGKKYDYTKPNLFRLGGIMDTVRIRNVHWVNTEDPSDFLQIGGNYIFFDEREGEYKTEISNLMLENIEIRSENGINSRGIVCKSSNVKNMVVKGVLSDVPLLETEGGNVENLYISDAYTPQCLDKKAWKGVKNTIVR